jgi:hypothetical protein
LYLLQQQALQQQRAERQRQDGDQGSAQSPPGTPAVQANQPPQQQTPPSDAKHWSFRNMTDRDKAGLAGLGVVLIALAFAAGIIPAKLTPKWLGRLLLRHE